MRPHSLTKLCLYALATLSLWGCSSLSHDGPAARSINQKNAKSENYALVDLDYRVAQQVEEAPPAPFSGLLGAGSTAPVDLIAAGDALSVSVFEAGANGIFSRPSELATGNTPQTFPRLVVDSRGALTIPFAGEIHVAGLTPKAASDKIVEALQGRAVDPQVIVTVLDSRANSVSVTGEVHAAGHFVLSASNDRLLDVITSAGGPTRPASDVEVVVVRGDTSARTTYSRLLRDPAQNIRLGPKDQVRLLYRPRKFATFGALLRDAQVPFEDEKVSLANALSRGGGLDLNTANAQGVYVFRFERPAVAQAIGVNLAPTPKGVPVVYRLNLRKPDGLFIASAFEIEPDDIVYVARSDVAEFQSFFNVVNVVSQTTYNVRATSTIP